MGKDASNLIVGVWLLFNVLINPFTGDHVWVSSKPGCDFDDVSMIKSVIDQNYNPDFMVVIVEIKSNVKIYSMVSIGLMKGDIAKDVKRMIGDGSVSYVSISKDKYTIGVNSDNISSIVGYFIGGDVDA